MKTALRKYLSILLACFYFASVTGLIELSKLPLLKEHYLESKNNQADLEFLDFLIMHYMTDDNNMNDDEQDRSLPYKSTTSCFVSLSVCIPQSLIGVEARPSSNFNKELPIYNPHFSGINFPDLVWNPPRTV